MSCHNFNHGKRYPMLDLLLFTAKTRVCQVESGSCCEEFCERWALNTSGLIIKSTFMCNLVSSTRDICI